MRADVTAWLARARADAESRGLAGLVPLLEALARSTAALRNADPSFTHAADAGPEGPAYEGSGTEGPGHEETAGPEGSADKKDAGTDGPAERSDAGDTAR